MNENKLTAILNEIEELNEEEIQEVYRRLRAMSKKTRTRDTSVKIVKRDDLRNITIIIQGHQYIKKADKPSSYEYVLVDEEAGKGRKSASGNMIGETTNRAILLGIMDAINRISTDRQCLIKVYTRGSWGFSKMKKQNKGINGDLLETLQALLQSRGDVLEAHIDAEVVSQYLS